MEASALRNDMGRINRRHSLILVTSLHREKNLVLDDYGMRFLINIGVWLVSLDCANTLIMMKSVRENMVPDRHVGHEHLPVSNRWKK